MTNLEGEEKLQACHVEKYFRLLKQRSLDDQGRAGWPGPVASRRSKECLYHF